jgi:phage baseplate assembly protein W
MSKEKSFLGTGWSFPPTFNKTMGEVVMVNDEVDIKESLQIYLSTSKGERLMRLGYGSLITEHIFDSGRSQNLAYLADVLKIDIRTYEPRIIVINVKVDNTNIRDGVVLFSIEYEIQSSNIRDNIVYPYYILEGTNIPK